MAGRDALGGPRERAGNEATVRVARERGDWRGDGVRSCAVGGHRGATRRSGCSCSMSGSGGGSSRRAALGSDRRRRCAALQAVCGGRERVPGAHALRRADGCPGHPGAARLTPRESKPLRGCPFGHVRQRSGTRAYVPPGFHCAASPPLKGGAPPLARQRRSAVGAAPGKH
jgi:hypothetical protein